MIDPKSAAGQPIRAVATQMASWIVPTLCFAELQQVAVRIVNQDIALTPLALRRAVNRHAEVPKLGCGDVEVCDFEFDVKSAILVGEQAQPAGTNVQEGEAARQVEHYDCARKPFIERERPIDIRNVERHACEGNAHGTSVGRVGREKVSRPAHQADRRQPNA